MLDLCSKPIFCSKIALKGKTCSRLLKPQKVAPNAKSCSKVAEHNRDRPTIAPCQGIQDSLGFWILFRGFWIPGAGFQSSSVERGFWIPFLSGISEYLSPILDSKVLDSGYHEQNFPLFWILRARISQILESGYRYIGEVLVKHFRTCSRIYNQAVGNLLFF